MAIAHYTLPQFVDDLRSITADTSDPRQIISRVRPLARGLALAKDTWLEPDHYRTNAAQGFGIHLLHEEPDHTLAVMAVAWHPGGSARPHNHGTWAVVVGVDGAETNVFWRRLDDGSRPGFARIECEGATVFGEGDVVSFLPESIHSVVNETTRVTISLHVYGTNLNYATRFQFDPAANTATPIVLTYE